MPGGWQSGVPARIQYMSEDMFARSDGTVLTDMVTPVSDRYCRYMLFNSLTETRGKDACPDADESYQQGHRSVVFCLFIHIISLPNH